MDIDSIAKWITLKAWGNGTGPSEALLVGAQGLPDPDTLMVEATPSVIAQRSDIGVPGLRVGTLAIRNFEVYQTTAGIPTVETHTGYYVSIEDLLNGLGGDLGTLQDWFSGGSVQWGDGTASDPFDLNEAISHTYPALGTYDIRLRLTFASSAPWFWSNELSTVRRVILT